MKKVKWLLVGAGDISKKRVAPALSTALNSEITAICAPRSEQIRSLATDYHVEECYTDFEEALQTSSVDAVYLATPVWLHAEHALKALEAGKHVLVEKPLGLSGEECLKVAMCANKHNKKSACAYYRRFLSRYLFTENMLAEGEFGQIVSVRLTYFSWFAPDPGAPKYWRVVRAKSGGGPLSDMGSHMFDVLIGLLGMPATVYAKCDNLVHRWDVEDSASIIMKLQNGAQVTASFNWNSKTWRHEFEIVGTEAKIDWLPYDMGPVVKTLCRDVQSIDLPAVDNVHLPLVENFVGSILDDRPVRYDLNEAVKTNILLDAIYESAARNREVIVESGNV